MGMLVGGAIVAHVPTIMLPEETRRRLGGGDDTTLVEGFRSLRARLDALEVDTLIIVDTHWVTTSEHILAGQQHHRGVYTSEELPIVIRDLPYDYPGAPELGRRVQDAGRAAGQRVLNATSDAIAHHYPTLNVIHHLSWDRAVLSTGVCQTAQPEDFLEFGQAIAAGVDLGTERAAILASGGLSHRFWPLGEFMDHAAYDPAHVHSPAARAFDEQVISWMAAGNHAQIIDGWENYRPFAPEGRFGHYLTMAGAFGGRAWRSPGTLLSEYENSYGTGQVHVWFDR